MPRPIDNDNLNHQIQELKLQVEALKKGAYAVLKHDNFESTARAIFLTLKDLIGATAGYVALLSETGHENNLLFLDSGDLICGVDPELPMPIRGLREKVYTCGKVVYENNFNNSHYMAFLPDGHVELQNVMFVPLVVDQKVVGVIGLANKPGGFSEDDASNAITFGEFAAIGLQNAKLEEDRNKYENSLIESEKRYQKLYQMMNEGVCLHEVIYDDSGKPVNYRILDVNKSYEKTLGVQKHEAVGRLATELYDEDLSPYFDIYLGVAQTGKPASVEIYSPQLGKYYQVSVFSPRPNQFACIYTDTTPEMIKEEYLSATLNTMGDGVIEIDNDGRIVRMNPVAEVLTDWNTQEAKGQYLNTVYHVVDPGSKNKEEHFPEIIIQKKHEKAFPGSHLLIAKTGKKYVIEEKRVPIKRRDGSVVGVFIIFRDQTERYDANVVLQENQIRYEELFKTIPSGVVVYDAVDYGKDFIIKEFNPSAESIEKINKNNAIGKKVSEVFPGIYEFGLFQVLQRVWESGVSETLPVTLYKDDRMKPTWRENFVYKLPSGETVAVYRDVTERIRSMEELKQREYNYRFIFENMAQGVFYQGKKFEILDANRSAMEIFGIDREEIETIRLNQYLYDVIGENGLVVPVDQYPSVLAMETGKPVRNVTHKIYNPKKEDHVWININAIPQFKEGEERPFQVFVTVHDVTDIKTAEMTIRDHKAELDAVFQNTPMVMILVDRDFNLYKINRAGAAIAGKKEEDIIGMKGGDALKCPYAEEAGCGYGRYCNKCEMWRIMLDTFETGKNHFMVQADMLVAVNGGETQTFNFLLSTALIRGRDKEMVLASYIDITEMRKAENSLRRLGEAVKQSSDGIVITDIEGAIIYVNHSYEQITGIKSRELMGRLPAIRETEKETKELFNSLPHLLEREKSWKERIFSERNDGSSYTVECSIFPVRKQEADIENFVVIIRDITSETRLEERLNQAQKLEAIGTLAGGIAHDFNNLLFPLVGYAEMLRDDVPKESVLRENIDEILHSALRARDLVQQILTFSRQTKQEEKAIKIQYILKEALKLLRSSIPKTIYIKQNIDENCGLVLADPTQIHQIIMNLSTNAFHAMEDTGGTLSISLQQIYINSEVYKNNGNITGKCICLKVSDTGKGIEKENLAKVFDPYFTTKPEGKGTGLGLSIVHGIVKKCGGDIRVFSTPGLGTDVFIYFPTYEINKDKAFPEDDFVAIGGNENILLVDDEEAIVEMEKTILERMGYRVTSRKDSVAAMETFEQEPQRFDLIITDMTMPNLTGYQLSKEIKRIRPEIPIIICTGYSDQIDEEKCKASGIEGYIMKPFIKKDLAETIRKVLGFPL